MCWSDLRKSGRYFFDGAREFPKERGWRGAVRFLLELQAINTVLTFLSLLFLVPLLLPIPVPPTTAESTALFLIPHYLGTIALVLVWAGWLHLWALLLGGHGVLKTFRSVVYGSSPRFWLGWLPFVGILFIAWAAVVTGIGLHKLHRMSGLRAAAALIAAVGVALAILVGLLVLLGTAGDVQHLV